MSQGAVVVTEWVCCERRREGVQGVCVWGGGALAQRRCDGVHARYAFAAFVTWRGGLAEITGRER